MKEKIKKWVRKFCPDIPILRKTLTRKKLKELKHYILKESEIEKGEAYPDEKDDIVKRQSEKWTKYADKLNRKIDEYLKKNPHLVKEKNLSVLRTDILFNCFAYGFMPDEYFSFHLEEKNRAEKEEYISDLEGIIYAYTLNDIIDLDIFYDKYRTYEKFGKYYKREVISIETEGDYQKFLNYLKKHPVFVKKPVALSRGAGVALIDSNKEKRSNKELFLSLISDGKQILEEVVIQSEIMKTLNASSVNTVRCPTFATKHGIELGPCRCRVGHKGSFVDNAGAGGILVGVNKASGELDSNGWDEYCNEFERHPESGIVFKGFQLPEWEQLIQTVTEMAKTMPSMGYISWDMAHTDNGWVVIEANGTGQFIGSQIVYQRGIKREVLEQLDGMLLV